VPIYEFYCADCHVIFNFFSASVNTTKRPKCPRCEKKVLERRMSRFATIKSAGDDAAPERAGPGGQGGADDARMERAMDAFAREADGINEDDPRQAAQMMRKLSEMAGMSIGPGMEEALKRIESGEDPDAVESELGDLLENEDPFGASADPAPGAASGTAPAAGMRGASSSRSRPPARDEKLYTL
jgi:putative FmdB family regulatory protein